MYTMKLEICLVNVLNYVLYFITQIDQADIYVNKCSRLCTHNFIYNSKEIQEK